MAVGAIKFIVTLPFRLVAMAIIIPIKTSLALLRFSAKAAFVTTRTALRSSLISLAAGIGLGWFFTSTPTGRQLVDQVRDLMGKPTGPIDDDQIAALVRTEMASGASTWHLPQPDVVVVGGVVTLAGTVPHATGQADLERAAASVRGVVAVNNSVTVADAPVAAEGDTTDAKVQEPADEPVEAEIGA